MGAIASQITSLTIVYSTVYSDADQKKKTPKLRVAGLCVGNSPVTGEFPTQMASNAGNVSIWWRHHEMRCCRTSQNMDNAFRENPMDIYLVEICLIGLGKVG